MSEEQRKPHLSASSLGTLAKCGEMYRWRYIEGIKAPPGVAAVIGKGAHHAVEQDLRHKMEWGALLDEEAVGDFAADGLRTAWDDEKTGPPVLHEGDPNKGGAVDAAVALAKLHHRRVAPGIQPIALERGFRLELDGFPFDLVGFIDVEERRRLRDTKTKTKAPPKNAAEVSDQLTMYDMEARARGVQGELGLVLDFLVRTESGKTRVITQPTERTENDRVSLLRRVEAAAGVIQKGAFAPTQRDNWWCSQKWCGYYDRCQWGARQSVTVGLIDPARLRSRPEERR